MYKYSISFITTLLLTINLFGQVGIGTDAPYLSSILDMKSVEQGVLLPRVQLTNVNTFSLKGGNTSGESTASNSLLVYNTTNNGNVTEGFYYWQKIGTNPGKWIKLLNDFQNASAADNGLKINNSQKVILGGALIEPTTLTASTTNTLAINGLNKTNNVKDNVIVSSTNGVLKTTNAVLPKVFYMPAITIDVSTIGTNKTINLYDLYRSQYATPTVKSTSAPAALPYYTQTELNYYITYFDATVFRNVTVDDNGLMKYDVVGTATASTYMNIVFSVK